MSGNQRHFSEKRDYIRMVVDCAVNYTELANGRQGVARGRNLSGKGILMIAERKFAPGDQLEIAIQPEKTIVPPLHAVVEVVRVVADKPGFQVGAAIREFIN